MTGWWTARARRERFLILGAGMLLLAALVLQGVVLPSLQAREAAAAALANGNSTLVRLERLRDAGAVYVDPQAAASAADARMGAGRIASELGLSIRSGAGPAGALGFTFAPAPATRVFSWIERAETELGLSVQSADLTGAAQGDVEAVVVLTGAAAR